ncbi:M1 family metallopeptidase [Mesonia ostreae]|uniref:Aminopeptidase N n=1 Tax=Mesonia ostreae TaxID=861110 RepID=A0ABU2KGE9_9FLAO|nr:M1 family metallopeptidase [Mesonia ostreae]MDT0293766.1 M1 family metallopeptidase [Mesonia ostreae]
MKHFIWLFLIVSPLYLKAQQTSTVNIQKISGTIHLLPDTKSLDGNLQVELKVLKATDSIYLDAKKATVEGLENTKFQISAAQGKIWFIGDFKAGKAYTFTFNYQMTPSQTMYFVGWDNAGSNQIWTQGQGKYTSHWLPSIDDVNDKIEFDLSYQVPKAYQVIANGKLISKKTKGEDRIWKYDMQNPMSSYLVAVAVGNYAFAEEKTESGITLQYYYEPENKDKVESTYRYSKQIFDFFETEIGIPFPWQDYKQVPVRDFLYAGMENTTATLFSQQFITDDIGFVDRNYVNVNAHELAHQWFGNFVTASSSEHHWLQEGFATFYALLAEREVFGEEYYYYKLYETAEHLKELSDSGEGEALLNAKASSLTFYQKGAWALHILKEKVGEEAFRKGVRTYLIKYAYQSVDTDAFLKEMELASTLDLSIFRKDWLFQSAFKADEALTSLKKSDFIKELLELKALRKLAIDDKQSRLELALQKPVNDYFGQEVVYQLAQEKPEEVFSLYKKAFESDNLLTRQAIAITLREIPRQLKGEMESLLDDDSYLTKEKAFMNLWQNFSEDRTVYFEKLEGVEGFQDKNIEILWSTLHLVSPAYKNDQKPSVFKKLSSYTSAVYDYAVRENAFGYLYQIDTFSKQSYEDLFEGTTHSVWRFKKFCRELLDTLWENPKHRAQLIALVDKIPSDHAAYAKKKYNL